MTLFFGYEDMCRCIAHPKDSNDVYNIISKFLKERKYKSYYTRVNTNNGVTTYDVGSWTQFFYSIDRDAAIDEHWEPGNMMTYTLKDLEAMA